MELKSEPVKYEEVHYTDIDVAYSADNRQLLCLILEDGKDSYEFHGSNIIVRYGSGEVSTLEALNRLWYSIRPRVHKRKVEDKA